MSRKNNLLKFKIIDAGDLSADITSTVTNIQFLDNIGMQINAVTADAVGTFAVEVSADYEVSGTRVINPGNWIAVNLPSTPVLAGANKSIFIDLNQLAAPWVRLTYARTSGSGTVDAIITAKML